MLHKKKPWKWNNANKQTKSPFKASDHKCLSWTTFLHRVASSKINCVCTYHVWPSGADSNNAFMLFQWANMFTAIISPDCHGNGLWKIIRQLLRALIPSPSLTVPSLRMASLQCAHVFFCHQPSRIIRRAINTVKLNATRGGAHRRTHYTPEVKTKYNETMALRLHSPSNRPSVWKSLLKLIDSFF